MRTTLRRSCDACAKAKHKCDLETPKCSRCVKRKATCVYANEPLAQSSWRAQQDGGVRTSVSRDRESSLRDSSFRVQQGHGRASVSTGQDVTRRSSPSSHEGIMKSSSSRSPDGITKSHSPLRTRQTSPLSDERQAVGLRSVVDGSFDPFDSYPAVRIARPQVQRLIHHSDSQVLSSIAFQYYPLDLSPTNPFVTSWFPLALSDPALFHVSLQTASLDEELRAQNGFPISTILMADSVMLLRQKVSDPRLAFRDDTLNAVVTLAAIEHGKGNWEVSRTHLEGVMRIVGVRGGIGVVKRESPLTARMISWVSMLVTGEPQFSTQDDDGQGEGIDPTVQWRLASPIPSPSVPGQIFDGTMLDPAMICILTRLRNIFHSSTLSTTELHDLTCFLVHKLLLLPPFLPPGTQRSLLSECFRHGMVLYMLVIHGTTYYHHLHLIGNIVSKLGGFYAALLQQHSQGAQEHKEDRQKLLFWILTVCCVAADWLPDCNNFRQGARGVAERLEIRDWEQALVRLKEVLWLPARTDDLFETAWEKIKIENEETQEGIVVQT